MTLLVIKGRISNKDFKGIRFNPMNFSLNYLAVFGLSALITRQADTQEYRV